MKHKTQWQTKTNEYQTETTRNSFDQDFCALNFADTSDITDNMLSGDSLFQQVLADPDHILACHYMIYIRPRSDDRQLIPRLSKLYDRDFIVRLFCKWSYSCYACFIFIFYLYDTKTCAINRKCTYVCVCLGSKHTCIMLGREGVHRRPTVSPYSLCTEAARAPYDSIESLRRPCGDCTEIARLPYNLRAASVRICPDQSLESPHKISHDNRVLCKHIRRSS